MMGEVKNFDQILKNSILFFLYKNKLYDNTHYNIPNVMKVKTNYKKKIL